MNKDTGGPAFPLVYDAPPENVRNVYQGMTLRDYFAAKALLCGGPADKPPAYDNDTRARYAYELADAMLKARSQ